jgi:hypothetical protein
MWHLVTDIARAWRTVVPTAERLLVDARHFFRVLYCCMSADDFGHACLLNAQVEVQSVQLASGSTSQIAALAEEPNVPNIAVIVHACAFVALL